MRASKDASLLLLAALVGLGAGLISVLFYHTINLAELWLSHQGRLIAAAWGPEPSGWWIPVVGAVGGVIIGLIAHVFAPEIRGGGVPNVMEAVARRGGRLRARVVPIKAIATSIAIGTGGSAGREGPIVQIGGAFGSLIGQLFGLSEAHIRTLVSCGVAAGISATFNAPLGGSLFALEVILGEFTTSMFSRVVIAAAVADVTAWSLLGNHPGFTVPAYELVSLYEIPLYAGLGLLCAGVAWLYTQSLFRIDLLFERLRAVPTWAKPALGGLLFGLVGWALPQTLGTGYAVMNAALHGQLLVGLLLALMFAKILATALTVGSGSSAGVFTPGLFVGAMAGGAYGGLVHQLWPSATSNGGAYALVGMGALFAGASQAPMAAILLLFELTRDYRIIVPLMLACVISSLVFNSISRETIYTIKLAARGVRLRAGRDMGVLREVSVGEAMTPRVDSVRSTATVGDLVTLMQVTRHSSFPVLNESGNIVGLVSLDDIRNSDPEGRLNRTVLEIMSQEIAPVYPDESLATIVERCYRNEDAALLPVVRRDRPDHLLGVLTRSDVLRAYNRALVQEDVNNETLSEIREASGS